MRWLLNAVYVLLLVSISPVIVWRMFRHGRYRQGLAEKLFGQVDIKVDGRPVVWFHAVSVGEVIQLQKVVDEFRRRTREEFQIVVSTSTDTGWELVQKRFADCQMTWFPLDFSWAVRRAIRRIQPAQVILMELELWPNFLAECHRLDVPVSVINARMSERSYRGYQRIRSLLKPLFSRLALVASQSQTYADRLISLGASEERTVVTGSIKFDGVETSRTNPKTESLRRIFGLKSGETVFMAGSTQEPEEQFALESWVQLRTQHPNLRLILVPRHRERFDEVAALVASHNVPLLRRSHMQDETLQQTQPNNQPVILLDTIGELSACWGLADVAFVGGSFGNRGGQNMMEPAAYGACVLFGPNTWNFRDVVERFREADGCVQLQSPDQLTNKIHELLNDSSRRLQLGRNAQKAVLQQQGATARTAELLHDVLLPVTIPLRRVA
ncbi:MAG: 3-deoxy-D-manno-octulosonic acid transferase [Planctomycetaceae bacterium]